MDKIRKEQTETISEGVRIRNGKCWIDFRWNGKRYRENTELEPTPKGKAAAARIRRKVVSEIELGIFGPVQFISLFPSSKRSLEFELEINRQNDDIPTFAQIAKEALAIKQKQVGSESFKKIKGYLNTWWMPYLAGLKINEIDEDLLENIDADHEWKSDKTRNNALSPLRFVFEKAMRKRIRVDGVKVPVLDSNPTECLKNGKPTKSLPDPFEPDERDAILKHLATYTGKDRIWLYYFTVAFYTGMRSNELLGLEWEQLDFNSKLIRVDRTMTEGKIRMETKTGVERDVPMLPIVEEALKATKQFTFLSGKHVFASPRYMSRPLAGPKAPNEQFQYVLKKLGIRQRRTYNTRHTFATQMLMDNVKPGFAAKILGHSLMVFFTKYAKWLETNETETEMAKISVNRIIHLQSPNT